MLGLIYNIEMMTKHMSARDESQFHSEQSAKPLLRPFFCFVFLDHDILISPQLTTH